MLPSGVSGEAAVYRPVVGLPCVARWWGCRVSPSGVSGGAAVCRPVEGLPCVAQWWGCRVSPGGGAAVSLWLRVHSVLVSCCVFTLC